MELLSYQLVKILHVASISKTHCAKFKTIQESFMKAHFNFGKKRLKYKNIFKKRKKLNKVNKFQDETFFKLSSIMYNVFCHNFRLYNNFTPKTVTSHFKDPIWVVFKK